MDKGSRAKTVEEIDRDGFDEDPGKLDQKPAKGAPAKGKKPDKKAKKTGKDTSGRADAPDPQDSGDAPKEKRRHPVRNALLFCCLFWLLLIGAVVAVCCVRYTDELGDRQYLLDPEGVIRGPILLFLTGEEDRETYYSSEQSYYTDWDAELDRRDTDISAKEEELDTRESQLDDRESNLDDREDLLTEAEENGAAASVQSGATAADVANMAKSLQEMTPAKAALAVAEISDEQILMSVLRLVKPAKMGKILDAMEPDYAAYVIEMMATPTEPEE